MDNCVKGVDHSKLVEMMGETLLPLHLKKCLSNVETLNFQKSSFKNVKDSCFLSTWFHYIFCQHDNIQPLKTPSFSHIKVCRLFPLTSWAVWLLPKLLIWSSWSGLYDEMNSKAFRPTQCLIFGGPMLIAILGSKKIAISDISANILYIKYFECSYQICGTKTCNGGRISNKLYPKHQCTEQ